MKLKFILVIIVLAALLACGQKTAKTSHESTMPQPVEVVYHVNGMTCDHCEESIQKGVAELQGINQVEANHADSTAKVIFDPSKTDEKAIMAAIEKRGYKVVLTNSK
ncbi:MAG: heavy-metal-associated domain-containing protein [Mangrovibacterium sp.]